MIHELKVAKTRFARIAADEKRALVRRHTEDFQVGDTLRLVRSNEHGTPISRWVEPGRDSQGRFTAGHMEHDALDTRVTHVQPAAQVEGLVEGYALLSIEVIEP